VRSYLRPVLIAGRLGSVISVPASCRAGCIGSRCPREPLYSAMRNGFKRSKSNQTFRCASWSRLMSDVGSYARSSNFTWRLGLYRMRSLGPDSFREITPVKRLHGRGTTINRLNAGAQV
jgi:hypothetical protein